MKTKVGIIFGGKSGEHEVSLMSASNVMKAMDEDKFHIVKIGITKSGKWILYTGDIEKIADGSWEKDEDHLIREFSIFNDETINAIDVFFPVLHGPNGEDGTVQGMLNLLNKPFIGCDVLASSVGMDKVFSKIVFKNAGIPIGPYTSLQRSSWNNNKENAIESVEEEVSYPSFIKPANMGSSVGISRADNREELIKGIEEAFNYDNKLIIEKAINCREIECAVLGNEDPSASILGEIIPSQEFYDYHAKYTDGDNSRLLIPAPLDDEMTEKIRNYAIKAFQSIDGRGLSRVDFFIDKGTNEVFINEINTLPGFTNISMYPKLWEASGIGYSQLIEKLIDLALESR